MTDALAALTLVLFLSIAQASEAQRLRFPPAAGTSPNTTYVPFQLTSQAFPPVSTGPPIILAQTPGVTLGSPQPVVGGAPSFDAYATPSSPVAQPILQQPMLQPSYVQQPYVQPGTSTTYGLGGMGALPSATGQYQFVQPNGTIGTVQRFLQQVRLRQTWVKGSGGDTTEMGVSTSEIDGTFMVPFFYLKDPFLITPGFAVHFLEGPGSAGVAAASLPSRLYDAYVDLGWQPVMTQWLKADLGLRVGVYSDFEKYDSQALRVLGRGYAVWSHSNTLEFKAGVLYLDRVSIKLLPAGGVVWMPSGPNGDSRWDILFPNPKYSRRLSYFGTWDVWWYVAGELGGGTWAFQRATVPPGTDQVEFQDYRLITGLEWTTVAGNKGFVEAGWVFNREINYRTGGGDKSLGDTFMLRGGVTF